MELHFRSAPNQFQTPSDAAQQGFLEESGQSQEVLLQVSDGVSKGMTPGRDECLVCFILPALGFDSLEICRLLSEMTLPSILQDTLSVPHPL